MIVPGDILDFWFVETPPERKFSTDPEFDAEIRSRYAEIWLLGRDGALSAWETRPEGALALVILLDQFPRNIYRGRREAFSSDAAALAVAKRAVERDFDLAIPSSRRSFFYMPFMHSEDIADQELSVRYFSKRLDGSGGGLGYALRHRDAIVRFGRFPARNRALGRTDTPEETAFLAANPAGF